MSLLKNKDIYIGILVLMILGTVLSSQVFCALSIAYYFVLIARNNFKLMIPRLPGFDAYLIMILYCTIIGFMMYSLRNVIRDLYYVIPTVTWIFIGYYICCFEENNEKDIFKTLYIYGAFVSAKAFISFLANFSLNFIRLRAAFGADVYDVGFILPLLVMQIFFYKKIYISRIADRVIIAMMFVNIILSFGRIAILEPVIMIFVIMWMAARHNTNQKRILFQIVFLLGILMVTVIVILYVLPETLTNTFMRKVLGSFTEVDTSQTIDSVVAAMNNWRAYEIQSAQQQWLKSNFLVQIFGNGFGKGIAIAYVPYSWMGIVENGEIPLLHNGFYTILIKGGLFGLISLIQMFIGNVYLGIKKAKIDLNNGYAIILVGVSVAAIANTYVVRGPIQQGAFLVWALLTGWINAYLRNSGKENQ